MKQELEEILDSLIAAHRIETPVSSPEKNEDSKRSVPLLIKRGWSCLRAGAGHFFRR